ncbi:MAG TPA: translation elongation factor Ts [Acidimicrobiales bacterium]|nr:translation elongation factor Ts [Acidimicrobiales bacterium]
MAEFTASDVQRLRQASGAGMMDAKRALVESGGDFEAASRWLREKGLAKSATRSDRDNAEGAVACATAGNVAALVELKCETDFVAKSDDFIATAQALADAVAADGEGAVDSLKDRVDDLKVVLKENIDVGRVVRIDAAEGNVLDTYLHKQDGRGKVAVALEVAGGSQELAHDIAIHIAFTKPQYLSRDEVPAEAVAEERETLTTITRNEGKPEAALEKIVEGKLNGWYQERVLLEQKFVRDEKQTITQLLGGASVVRFGLIVIGA